MIRIVVFISCMLFVTKCVQSQNYIQQYPINAIIDNAGNQNRIIFSVYDSVLASYQYYFTPYYQTNLQVSNSDGAFVGYNAISPGPTDSVFGFITYDHFLHQFAAVEKFHSDPMYPGAWIAANDAGIIYEKLFDTVDDKHQTTVEKYELNQHLWKKLSTFIDPDWSMGSISMWAMAFTSSDLQIGDGYLTIFDPSISTYKSASVGCYFNGSSMVDDYFKSGSGPCENDGIYAYNSMLHTWNKYAANNTSYGRMHKGIFNTWTTMAPFHNYFAYYDEPLNSWQTDTLFHPLNDTIIIKDRIISFIDSTINGTSVHFKTYDLVTHSFKIDSISAPGANSLAIQDGTVSWNDLNGSHIRGYNDSLGWGNYPTTIVPQFYLTDLYAQTGLPIIRVRNYTIGTDSIVYDFGDGITSVNNGHVLWHQYNGPGPYTVTISDQTGAFSSSQTKSFPCYVTSAIENSCGQLCNGSIEIFPPSFSTNYSLVWNTGSTSTILDSLCAGSYIYTFTDSSGCVKTDTIEISEPFIDVITNPTCIDNCTASIAVSYTEGPSQTSYLWNTGDTLPYLSNLCPGNYSLTITSANQCIDTLSVTIDSSFTMTSAIISPYCYNSGNGSSITINTSGGVPPFQCYWPFIGWATNPLIDEGAGTFELYLSDFTGCTDTFLITVPNPPQIVFTGLSTDPSCSSCSDGIIALNIVNATPPYNITWTPNIGTLSGDSIFNLPVGPYKITVTDSNSCVRVYRDTLNFFVNINEHVLNDILTLAPNPASDKVTINFKTSLLSNCSLQINDALGKAIINKEIIAGTIQTEIDISELPPAIYFVNIKGIGFNYYRSKLVKY